MPPISTMVRVVVAAAALFLIAPLAQPIAWAAVGAVAVWPLNVRIRGLLPSRSSGLAAALICAALSCAFVIVVIPLARSAYREARTTIPQVESWLDEVLMELPPTLHSFPGAAWVHEQLPNNGKELTSKIDSALSKYSVALVNTATWAAEVTARLISGCILALFILFFMLKDGDVWLSTLRRRLDQRTRPDVVKMLHTAASAVSAVVYGFLLTAIAQGFLASIGYLVSGAPSPVFLGLLTTLLSLLPFGAPLVYVPTALWLAFAEGSWSSGIGLFLWGICVVSTVDNFIRPLVISHTTQLPLVLGILGIFGGVIHFGLIGIFLGPMVMAWAFQILREGPLSN